MTETPSISTFSTDIIGFSPTFNIPSEDKKVAKKFGLPLFEKLNCPACGVEGEMMHIIAHLNNKEGETNNWFDHDHGTHNWTFKQIGEWLKELGY